MDAMEILKNSWRLPNSSYTQAMEQFQMPDSANPYTEEQFRANVKNRMGEMVAEVQNQMLASQAAEIPEQGIPQGAPGAPVNIPNQSEYQKYGTYDAYKNHLSAALVRSGFPAEWAAGITELVKRESGFNPTAKNPNSTAHGYGQFLNSTRANYEKKTGLSYDDPVNQLIMMMQYVKDRYGSPDKALNFWNNNKWY